MQAKRSNRQRGTAEPHRRSQLPKFPSSQEFGAVHKRGTRLLKIGLTAFQMLFRIPNIKNSCV